MILISCQSTECFLFLNWGWKFCKMYTLFWTYPSCFRYRFKICLYIYLYLMCFVMYPTQQAGLRWLHHRSYCVFKCVPVSVQSCLLWMPMWLFTAEEEFSCLSGAQLISGTQDTRDRQGFFITHWRHVLNQTHSPLLTCRILKNNTTKNHSYVRVYTVFWD